jgi:hypothetical protein
MGKNGNRATARDARSSSTKSCPINNLLTRLLHSANVASLNKKRPENTIQQFSVASAAACIET